MERRRGGCEGGKTCERGEEPGFRRSPTLKIVRDGRDQRNANFSRLPTARPTQPKGTGSFKPLRPAASDDTCTARISSAGRLKLYIGNTGVNRFYQTISLRGISGNSTIPAAIDWNLTAKGCDDVVAFIDECTA